MIHQSIRCLTLLLLLLALAPVCGAQVMQQYPFQPDRLYEVRTALGITTQIELDPNEQVRDFSTGFSSGWELDRRENVFYLKPKNVDVDTNLTIRTARHTYFFELKVVATDWRTLDQAKNSGVHYRVSFIYPKDTSFEVEKGRKQLDQDKGGARYFDYAYSAGRAQQWLVPLHVHDDGRFTYIRLGDRGRFPSSDFPAVFARASESGEDFVVNSSIDGDTIVIHGTYPYLVLRHGRDVVGIRRNAP